MNTNELIEEATARPVEDRIKMVDALLQSLNTPEASIDQAWLSVIEQRRQAVGAGEVQTVPAANVFAKINQRRQN